MSYTGGLPVLDRPPPDRAHEGEQRLQPARLLLLGRSTHRPNGALEGLAAADAGAT